MRLALTIAFIVRAIIILVIFCFHSADLTYAPDTTSYISPAENLLSHGVYGHADSFETKRTPGYPLLFLPGLLIGHLELVTVLIQLILSLISVYLVGAIVVQLGGDKWVGALAALLYAVEPLSVWYTAQLLTETFGTFCVLLSVSAALSFMRNQSFAAVACSGLAASYAIFIRPINYYLPLVILIFIIAVLVRQRSSAGEARRSPFASFARVIVFILCAYLPVAGWQIRNYATTGYAGFSSISDVNWYFYMGASVEARKAAIPFYKMQEQLGFNNTEAYLARHPEQRLWSEAQRYDYIGQEGRKIVRNNLDLYLPIHVDGVIRMLIEPGALPYLGLLGYFQPNSGLLGRVVDDGVFKVLRDLVIENPMVVVLSLVFGGYLAILYIGAAAGALQQKAWARLSWWLVIGVVAYFVIISGGPAALGRFRHPIMPFVCILAGFGLAMVVRKFRKPNCSTTDGGAAAST